MLLAFRAGYSGSNLDGSTFSLPTEEKPSIFEIPSRALLPEVQIPSSAYFYIKLYIIIFELVFTSKLVFKSRISRINSLVALLLADYDVKR